ncbi:MAG: transcription antitermination factor NusB [Gemmatimonadota bacterium]|nr:transcription antitermination factor NusB [Gemmatimonadota bacterium]
MLRIETKGRARALQMLYAWELQGRPALRQVATGLARLTGPEPHILDHAEALAAAVAADADALDRETQSAAENWRINRLGAIERNILRLGVYELRESTVPPKVAIDEAVRLAHWFGGARSPGFVNGVLDRIAHQLGRL